MLVHQRKSKNVQAVSLENMFSTDATRLAELLQYFVSQHEKYMHI